MTFSVPKLTDNQGKVAWLMDKTRANGGLAPVDLDKFWADQEIALKDPWGRNIPQAAMGIMMSGECVYDELGVPEDYWRYDHDEPWRLELNKAYNAKSEKIVGRRLLGEKPGDPTDPSDPANQGFGNLWKIYRVANLEDAAAYNTVSTAAKVFKLDTANLCGTLYRVSDDEMLLVLANIGPTTTGKVQLDFAKLGMKPGAFAGKAMRVDAAGEWSEKDSVTAANGAFDTGEMGRFDVAAFHLKRQ